MLVKPDVAERQIESQRGPERLPSEPGEDDEGRRALEPPPPLERQPPVLRRFHGSVSLDPERLGRDAGRVAEEIVQHLTTQKGAAVEITLEIQARLPQGAPDNIVRTVTENARTLKFKTHGFEEE